MLTTADRLPGMLELSEQYSSTYAPASGTVRFPSRRSDTSPERTTDAVSLWTSLAADCATAAVADNRSSAKRIGVIRLVLLVRLPEAFIKLSLS